MKFWASISKFATKRDTPAVPQATAFTAEDQERVDRIIAAISSETYQIFDLMKDGMVRQANFKTVEESITRNYILSTFSQVRADAYRDSAKAARQFAQMCVDASNRMNESHQRVIAKCVAELFERFAGQIDRPELPASEDQPPNLLLLGQEPASLGDQDKSSPPDLKSAS